MVTELVFKVLFAVPTAILRLLPERPDIEVAGGFVGLLELLAIGNQFFPVGALLLYLSVWIALNMLALTKSFIDWILSVIPLY